MRKRSPRSTHEPNRKKGDTMNYRSFVVAAVGLAVACTAGSTQVLAFFASYEQSITMTDDVVSTSKVLIKDEKLRIESSAGGMTQVLIRNPQGMYTYSPEQKLALKLPDVPFPMGPMDDPEHYLEQLKEQEAVVIGTETIRGYICNVYQFQNPNEDGTTTAWVWTERGFPVRIEMESPRGTTTVELTNIDLDTEIPDAAFEFPLDVNVLDPGRIREMQMPLPPTE